jgi:hypothetical protein
MGLILDFSSGQLIQGLSNSGKSIALFGAAEQMHHCDEFSMIEFPRDGASAARKLMQT